MYFKFSLLFVFCIIYNVKTQDVNKKRPEIEVLYESLCPDSVRFITQQLYPAWKEFGPYVNVKFVPFGKSDSIGDERRTFECQHGPRECDGNKLQSCALKNLSDQNSQVEFVNCFMENYIFGSSETTVSTELQCYERVGLNIEIISNCFQSDEGTNLQLEAEVRTKQKRPISARGNWFVPTILINGEHHPELQNQSLVNFAGVLKTLVLKASDSAK